MFSMKRALYSIVDVLTRLFMEVLGNSPRWLFLLLIPFVIVPGMLLAMWADHKGWKSEDVL
jgi:hypothetical protein